MATEKPRFTITLSEDLYQKVNEYQHSMRFSTQTKAIVDLIERGAKSLGLIVDGTDFASALAKNVPPDEDEASGLIKAYNEADPGIRRSVRKLLDLEQPS